MKKILIILGTITLIGTITISLDAYNKPKYAEEELVKLKERNKINTKDGILEWIAPQEKPFNKVDNKYYYVVWRGNKNNNWRIIEFKHFKQKIKTLDKYGKYELKTSHFGGDLFIYENGFVSYDWNKDNGTYFKAVYRWNFNKQKPDLIVNINGNIKVNG